MSRRPVIFRQSDIARAVRAVTRLGLKVAEVKIDADSIRVVTVEVIATDGDDAELARFRARHGYQ